VLSAKRVLGARGAIALMRLNPNLLASRLGSGAVRLGYSPISLLVQSCRAAKAVKKGDAAAAAIRARRYSPVWCPRPCKQAQIQRIGSAAIGGFREHSPAVHELVAELADMAPPRKRRHPGEGARVATQRGHCIHTRGLHRIRQRLAKGRGMARLPRKQNRAPALRRPHR
jgi:hypothetical protein